MNPNIRNIAALARLGLSDREISSVLGAAKTLRHWAELYCGTEQGMAIRDEGGRPVWVCGRTGQRKPIRDTETPAKARLAQACQRVGAEVVFEGDPRGPVVVITKGQIKIIL